MNVNFSGLKHYMSNSRVACAVQRTVGAVFDAVAAEGRDEIAGELQFLATVFESVAKTN